MLIFFLRHHWFKNALYITANKINNHRILNKSRSSVCLMCLEWIPSDLFSLMSILFISGRICLHSNCVYNHLCANTKMFRAFSFLIKVSRNTVHELPIFHNVLSLFLQLIKSDMFGSSNSDSQCSVREIKIPISRHRHQKKTAARPADWHQNFTGTSFAKQKMLRVNLHWPLYKHAFESGTIFLSCFILPLIPSLSFPSFHSLFSIHTLS